MLMEIHYDYMVEEISQVTNQITEAMLEELCLETFLICCFVVVHHLDGFFDFLV